MSGLHRVHEALGLFASVIKSGEPWTASCQCAFDAAKSALLYEPPEMPGLLRECSELLAAEDVGEGLRQRIATVLLATQHEAAPESVNDAMVCALAYVRWTAFGECRTRGWDGPSPTASEVAAILTAALNQREAAPKVDEALAKALTALVNSCEEASTEGRFADGMGEELDRLDDAKEKLATYTHRGA